MGGLDRLEEDAQRTIARRIPLNKREATTGGIMILYDDKTSVEQKTPLLTIHPYKSCQPRREGSVQ